MRQFLLIQILLTLSLFFSTNSLNAEPAQVNEEESLPPQLEILIGGTTLPASITSALNAVLGNNFNIAIDNANAELESYDSFRKLAKGFGNANACASNAGTLQGYQDYSLFAITTGIMLGVQLPSIEEEYYNDLADKVKDDGDLYAGASPGISIVNLGINAGSLYEGLYFNLKLGYLSLSPVDGLNVKSTLLGFGLNYSLIRTGKVLFGFLKWRGISLGTGFLYNKSEIELEVDLSDEIDPVPFEYTPTDASYSAYTISGNLVLDPSFIVGIDSNTYTIPFDISTSVRMLWIINFNLGGGVDLNFGSSEFFIKASGKTTLEDTNISGGLPATHNVTPGNIVIEGSSDKVSPSFARPKITTGLGINFGPVKIDVPIVYYLTKSFAIGLTVGVVW